MRVRILKSFLAIIAFVITFCSVFFLASCGYNVDYIEATYKIENPYDSDIFTSSSTLTVSLTADENADENFVFSVPQLNNTTWYFTWSGLNEKVKMVKSNHIANSVWTMDVYFESSETRSEKYFSFGSKDWSKTVEIYGTDIVFTRVD